jgi:hypothetical protein
MYGGRDGAPGCKHHATWHEQSSYPAHQFPGVVHFPLEEIAEPVLRARVRVHATP